MVFCNDVNMGSLCQLMEGHNPYFSRWFSAIQAVEGFQDVVEKSQSLF